MLICLPASLIVVPAADLRLAEEGVTNYRIVRPENGTPVDDYAAANLAKYLHRWQTLFERMEAAVADVPEHLLNVRLLRRELDLATLWKWFELREAHPGVYTDHALYVDRITAANEAPAPTGRKPRFFAKRWIRELLTVIRAGGQSKPLPEQFAGIEPDRIRQYLPRNYDNASGMPKTVPDPDAAFGYAATVHRPDLPFQVGYYMYKSRSPVDVGKHGPRIKIAKDRITPGVYSLYDLGEITVIGPDDMLWFSARSWATHLIVGARVYEPGADNRWHAWVSLKFDGPTYGGTAEEDLVLVGRIILVRLGKGQFEAQ